MTKKQLQAIAYVERAMKALERSGLALAGIDQELFVFSRKEYDKIVSQNTSPYTACGPAEVMNEMENEIIKCPYIDSAGF